ncbi:MAG: GMC family oxidoreductase, partial [Spirochaetia bacterium]|nr:GMC family oxidoreductase [Spirochaetia bacterium]
MAVFQYNDIRGGRIKTDVCVIGSGCGGATAAKKLLQKGFKVIVLEQGGYYTTDTFDNHELNMAGKVSGDRNLFTTTDGNVNLLFGHNVGGASVHYWADSYRTPDDRLLLWEKKFGITGHRKEDLEPAFAELDKRLNVHPAGDEFLNQMNRLVEKGSHKLGWHGHRVPQARKNCQKSGHCMQGC